MLKGKSLFGIFLVFSGSFLLLERLALIDGDIFLLLLGVAFLLAYFINSRTLGFLIPGSLLTWLGLYTLLMEQTFWEIKNQYAGGLLFLALGLAFCCIFIHTFRQSEGHLRFWPLYPGIILILFSLIVEFEFAFIPKEYLEYINTYWPGILVLIGLILLVTSRRQTSESE